jgi:hypothetical protein
MKWNDISNEAKSVIEWVQNPYTDKYEKVEIEVGKLFIRSGGVNILITTTLFKEIVKYCMSDNELNVVSPVFGEQCIIKYKEEYSNE